MTDDTRVVINSDQEAKEVVQKRADAYEHTVKKASSLLQLIIGGLSVIAALAAAGLLTEFTAVMFDPDGINELTTNEAIINIFLLFVLLLLIAWGVMGMIMHLISILLNRDYPGVISPEKSISYQNIVDTPDNEQPIDDVDNVRYKTWLIQYACGKTDSKSPLSEVQKDYRVAVYAGVSSSFVILLSVTLLNYLFEGVRAGVISVNISNIVLASVVILGYFNSGEDMRIKQDLSRSSILIMIFLLIIIALLSGGATWLSGIELYQQYI